MQGAFYGDFGQSCATLHHEGQKQLESHFLTPTRDRIRVLPQVCGPWRSPRLFAI